MHQFIERHRLPDTIADAIDMSHDVRPTFLIPGAHLVSFRNGAIDGPVSWNPHGLFFSELTTIGMEPSSRPDKRLYSRYIVVRRCPALRFRASARTRSAPVGLPGASGWQFIVPEARANLKRIER